MRKMFYWIKDWISAVRIYGFKYSWEEYRGNND